LLAIGGVEDAIVFVPHADARPSALVVAPTLSAKEISNSLRDRIDPVFLPRPLIVVDALPRNDVGKLPQETLIRLLESRNTASDTRLVVAADHPSLAGHFPGNPIVPGVVLLDLIVVAAQARLPENAVFHELRSAKFILPVKPNDPVDVTLKVETTPGPSNNGEWRMQFKGVCNDLPVIEGSFSFRSAKEEMPRS
jgi:AMP-binding enzyme C-terminal domain/FabA-like domain